MIKFQVVITDDKDYILAYKDFYYVKNMQEMLDFIMTSLNHFTDKVTVKITRWENGEKV